MRDVIMLFRQNDGFHINDDKTDSYMFTSLDFAVADRFRSALLEFAETGQIAKWTATKPGSHVVCNIASEGTVCDSEFKRKECALLDAYGVSYGNWNVN